MDHARDVAGRIVEGLRQHGAKVSQYPHGDRDEVRLFVWNHDGTMARVIVQDVRELGEEEHELEDYPT